jgi:hypothetical protein
VKPTKEQFLIFAFVAYVMQERKCSRNEAMEIVSTCMALTEAKILDREKASA